MQTGEKLYRRAAAGGLDKALSDLYTQERLPQSRERVLRALRGYAQAFGPGAVFLASAPGRTELGGNHTDHQRGRVLCGSIDLDMLACAGPNGGRCIRLISEEFGRVQVDWDRLAPRPEEAGTAAALVRGMAAQAAERGCPPVGFDLYVSSLVPVGSGLSSSAAFEILLGTVLNRLSFGGRLDGVDLARMGQRAENLFFGKPCGMLDQMACALGGAAAVDFLDAERPAVRRVGYDFSQSGYTLCLVDTGSSHADLTDEYAAIPAEMEAVARCLGGQVLRQVDEAAFFRRLPRLRSAVGDRAVMRALHFFEEERRVEGQWEALDRGDFQAFLRLTDQSGLSSACLLQNLWPGGDPARQAVPLALALGRSLLGGQGAIRVHGGGFAGAVQAFVPRDQESAFRAGMEAVFGAGACRTVRIRAQGGCILAE